MAESVNKSESPNPVLFTVFCEKNEKKQVMWKYDTLQENLRKWNDKRQPYYLFLRERRPSHGFPTNQMNVQMLYGLSPVFPGVDDKTESAFLYSQLFRNLRNLAQHIPDQRRLSGHHIVRMGFGN